MTTVNPQLYAQLGIVPGSPSETVLRSLLELSTRFVGAEEGSILSYDRAARDLVFVMTVGNPEMERALTGQRLGLDEGLSGEAALTLQVQIGSPIYKEIGRRRRREGEEEAPECVMAAPMIVADELVGVITAVTFEKGRRFTPEHAELYARVATIAGIVVEQNHRLEALAGAPRPATALAGAAEELEIARLVGEIVRAKPGKLAQVAALLAAIAALE